MNTKFLFAIFCLAFVVACQKPKAEVVARDYYQALNTSDFERIAQLQFDSVRVKEGPYNTAYSILAASSEIC